jgi:prepilin-type N-terminal cleavage/methylation domain-containing protein/prepilin-type processing-associated H-X9-DG protein
MRPRQKRPGFTLVELLVVIGIIALLIAMLLPALRKARESAVTVSCASRMRQLDTAVMMFASDNKGSLPPIFAGSATNFTFPSWWNTPCIFPWNTSNNANTYNTGYLTPYIGYNVRVYVCPSLETSMLPSTSAQWSYQYNRYLGGQPDSWWWLPVSGTWAPCQPYKLGQVKGSSNFALFVDGANIQTTNNAGPPSGANGIGNTGNKLWFREDPAADTGAYSPPNAYHLPAPTAGFQFHSQTAGPAYTVGGVNYGGVRGMINIAFVDGSVRSIPWQIDRFPYKPIDGVWVRPEDRANTW